MTTLKFVSNKKWPPTDRNKFMDMRDALENIRCAIKYYNEKNSFHMIGDDFIRHYSLKELHAINIIIEFQAHRRRAKIFPSEYESLQAFCIKCKEFRLFNTIPPHSNIANPESVRMYSHCYHADTTHNLTLIEQKKHQKILDTPLSPTATISIGQFMGRYYNMRDAINIRSFYLNYLKPLSNIPVEDFFINISINGKTQLMCPACHRVYKRKDMAEIHNKHFWNVNDFFIGCQKGVEHVRKQKMEKSHR